MIYRISIGNTERGNIGFCIDLACESNKKSEIIAAALTELKSWQDTPLKHEIESQCIKDAVLYLGGNDSSDVEIVRGEYIDDTKHVFSILGKWEGGTYFYGQFECAAPDDGDSIMAAAFKYVCDSSGMEREASETLEENSIEFEPILIFRGKCKVDQVYWGDTGLTDGYKSEDDEP